jgi:hypothetical protein
MEGIDKGIIVRSLSVYDPFYFGGTKSTSWLAYSNGF